MDGKLTVDAAMHMQAGGRRPEDDRLASGDEEVRGDAWVKDSLSFSRGHQAHDDVAGRVR